MEQITVTFFGVRGSSPSFKANAKYGVNTSCTLVEFGDTAIVFDCGSGAYLLNEYLNKSTSVQKVHMLLSHMHLDHIMGFPCFEAFNNKSLSINVYGEKRGGLSLREQLEKLLLPPFWPVGLEVFAGKPQINSFDKYESFDISDDIHVDTMESNHPNDSTVFRVKIGSKTIVYALDFEHSEKALPEIIEFARDCDLLIYDAAYTQDMYSTRVGWGHSTWEVGKKVSEASGAKYTAFSHFAYSLSDEELDSEMKRVGLEKSDTCFPAREGMVLKI